jgi:hypothetical protein
MVSVVELTCQNYTDANAPSLVTMVMDVSFYYPILSIVRRSRLTKSYDIWALFQAKQIVLPISNGHKSKYIPTTNVYTDDSERLLVV